MKSLSAKNRIIIILAIWLGLCLLNFGYLFKTLDSKNLAIFAAIQKQKQTLASLIDERESEKQAQRDFQALKNQVYQPEDFFSKDITLVNEVKVLENLRDKYGFSKDEMVLSGISGTIKTVPKAKTKTNLSVINYHIIITSGGLAQTVNFLENLENLGFITNIDNFSITATGKGIVSATISANFYLRQ